MLICGMFKQQRRQKKRQFKTIWVVVVYKNQHVHTIVQVHSYGLNLCYCLGRYEEKNYYFYVTAIWFSHFMLEVQETISFRQNNCFITNFEMSNCMLQKRPMIT
jgi:hypothetical protein